MLSASLNKTFLSLSGHGVGAVTRFCVGRKEQKEMFYLMTHSTHFIYGYIALEK